MRATLFVIVCGCLSTTFCVSQPALSKHTTSERTTESTADGALDNALVERLARYYRIQNYEANRLDRAEYDRRNNELKRRTDAWWDSGHNAEQTRELIEWLNGELDGIDAAPQRTTSWIDQLPTPEVEPTPHVRDLNPETHTAPAVPLPEDPTLPEAIEQSSTAMPTAPKLSSGQQPAKEGSVFGGIRSTIDSLVKRVEQVPAMTNLPSSVPPPVTLNQLTDVPDAPPFVSPAFAPQTVPKLDINVPKVGGLAEMRGRAQRPGSRSKAGGGEGRVNFTEVAALTRGYNVSIQELETKLSKNSAWTVETLEPLMDELEGLARRREDLDLYNKALPAEEQSQLVAPDSMDQTIRLLGKRIAEVRNELKASGTASTDVTRRDLTQLDTFSRRLATLGSGGR